MGRRIAVEGHMDSTCQPKTTLVRLPALWFPSRRPWRAPRAPSKTLLQALEPSFPLQTDILDPEEVWSTNKGIIHAPIVQGFPDRLLFPQGWGQSGVNRDAGWYGFFLVTPQCCSKGRLPMDPI